MAVRIEDVKRDGIAVDVDALARTGFEAISEADRYRLKTQGVCAQRQVGVFMLRIRVPGGKASAEQLRRVAALADRYGHGGVHVTSRGGLELHHVRIADVPAVWAELADVGLTTKGTCGDTIRNVVACTHAEPFAGAVLPTEPFVDLLHRHIVAISDATNISRKMNVAIGCSPACDDHVATSDIGFVAVPGPAGIPGFAVWGAGGLGAAPRLAIPIAPFVAQHDVLAAFTALVALGEKHGDRTNRARAKIKMLVDAWGAETVREVFAEELALAKMQELPAIVAGAPPPPASDRVAVPALVPMGELSSEALRGLAAAAERFSSGTLQLTSDQNAELHGVAAADVHAAAAALGELGLRTEGRGGIADVLSCVGLEYCALAVAGSMTLGEEIARAMEPRRTDPRYADFRIHVSGCPHSCAKHQVADVGLAGATTTVDGIRTEAFVLYLGGNAHERRLGATHPRKLPRARVVPVVEALLAIYERERRVDERFSAVVARLGVERFFAAADRVLDGLHPEPDVVRGHLVVIGNGMTGARLVEELRRRGDGFRITVYGDERGGSYNRIMLSGVLAGHREAPAIVTHPPDWYDEHGVTLRSGVRIARIDRERRVVVDEDGREETYDALVLATGSRPFLPPIPGLDHPAVHAFRTLGDVDALLGAASRASRAVVLGGGLLGLEAASALRRRGVATSVVHLMPTLMEQQLDPLGGSALQGRIEQLGIEVRTLARAVRVHADGDRLRGVELDDGTLVEADFVVACCGIVPNAELAREAGVPVARAILVDDGLRTADAAIYAVGECVEHRGRTYGLVEPLWEQCRVLADRLTGGTARYAGSRVGTRLKVAGVDVVALGERDARPGDTVAVSIEADGRFRRAIARDGMLVGAQVVGDAVAASTFAQAFQRAAPLAGTLGAFIFGIDAAAPAAPSARAADELVCLCNSVSASTIRAAVAAGATSVDAIGEATGAGTGCGSCRSELCGFVAESAAPPERTAA